MRGLVLLLLLLGWVPSAHGASPGPRPVVLQGPLTTTVPLDWRPADGTRLRLTVVVPATAPGDLGMGAFCTDREGSWFQRLSGARLRPGANELTFDLGPDAALRAEPAYRNWHAVAAAEAYRAGVFFWTASASRVTVELRDISWSPASTEAKVAPAPPRLLDLRLDDLQADGNCHLRTGRRWELHCRPSPFPAQPFAAEDFRLEARITDERGRVTRLRGFYEQPMRLEDRGDREVAEPVGDARFTVRWRPQQPGVHRIELSARWGAGDQEREVHLGELPALVVGGGIWDDYVRVDAVDPRFFSIGQATGASRFFWPVGLNIRSVNDPRGTKRTGSRLSPDRGYHAYVAYLERLAAGGGNLVEVWMSSWNLALEWREDWPGFRGIGRYHQGNADRLDRLLDRAYELGIRVNLVIRNHGMGSYRTDREWHNNPWNARLQESRRDGKGDAEPGPIGRAEDFFTDPVALAGQEQLRRYLIARYADHPAILGWKLWTEQNLTAGRPYERRQWHIQAGDRWHELDPYRHPVTSHWSGNYRTPDRAIVRLTQLDYVCIDAYHKTAKRPEQGSLADLIWAGTQHPSTGLAVWRKPIVITEYGGNWNAAPLPQLEAEHRFGAWACLVTGYGSGPLLWWFEWVDQEQLYAPYRAVRAFLEGEDLRSQPGPGGEARSATLPSHSAAGELWAHCWFRRGRLLGYCLDRGYAWNGAPAHHAAAEIVIGERVSAGTMRLEWWHADTGERLPEVQTIEHGGGPLRVTAPAFDNHLAFKLYRIPNEPL